MEHNRVTLRRAGRANCVRSNYRYRRNSRLLRRCCRFCRHRRIRAHRFAGSLRRRDHRRAAFRNRLYRPGLGRRGRGIGFTPSLVFRAAGNGLAALGASMRCEPTMASTSAITRAWRRGRFVDIEMIDVRIGPQIDVDQRTVEARSAAHPIMLAQIEHPRDIGRGGGNAAVPSNGTTSATGTSRRPR